MADTEPDDALEPAPPSTWELPEGTPMLAWGLPDIPVHAALTMVMREITYAPKLTPAERGRAQASGSDRAPSYAYRSIDDVLNRIHVPLARWGVLIEPEIVAWEREEWPHYNKPAWSRHVATVEFTITGPRGDTKITKVRAEALDDGDKGFGKLYSYAVKNATLILFAIPTQPGHDIDGAARPETGTWEEVAERGPMTDENRARWRQHKPTSVHEWKKYAEAWGRTLADVRVRMGWTGRDFDTWTKVQDKLSREDKAHLWKVMQVMFTDEDDEPFGDAPEPVAPSADDDPAADSPAEAPTEPAQAPDTPEPDDVGDGAEEAPQPALPPEEVARIEGDLAVAHDAAVAARRHQADPEPLEDVDTADRPEPTQFAVPTNPAGWRAILPPAMRTEVASAFDAAAGEPFNATHGAMIVGALRAANWSTSLHRLSDNAKQAVVDYLNLPEE